VEQTHNAKQFFDKKISDANDPRLMLFNDMVAFMDAISINDHEKADAAIQRIARESREGLYQEVGKVTRKLHDSIRNFKESIDPKIKALATSDMPNAVDKLQFVIAETENAANKTMGIVEKHMLGLDTLGDHIKKIEQPAESVRYLSSFKNELEDDLVTILTTQQFQDLTGQTIKKVITLVGEIEGELVKLVTTFGDVKPESGTATPTETSETVSQSDVDDLLKELGF
jgi:chemotaxis protein CheZ